MTSSRIYPRGVSPRRLRRLLACALSLCVTTVAVVGAPFSAAQTAAECQQPGEETPEEFGPTDISAVSGNRKLSVAVNDRATVTVLKWPSPSYYDQIKYRTVDRSLEFMGALPNEGAFIGIAWRGANTEEWEFKWLRDLPATHRYADDDSDEIVTTFTQAQAELTVTVRDVVASDRDVMFRKVSVARSSTSSVRRVRVISFANFNPVFSKNARAPFQDWCSEERNDEGGTFDEELQAVVYSRSGLDESTGRPSSVAMTMGFIGATEGHQLGQDNYATGAPGTSAYDDAQDGELTGSALAAGQSDAAIADDLDLTGTLTGSTTVMIAAAPDEEGAAQRLEAARAQSSDPFATKRTWWKSWLKKTVLPRNAPRAVTTLSKRSLISIRQTADPGGLIVASIATQSPQGLDWVRNGAYINRALDLANHPEMVTRHNIEYARLQSTSVSKPIGGEATPPGNWSQNYYADGVVGGPIPYEIDETGLGIWTLWDHYRYTRSKSYLLSVYEEIQRAAQYLTDVCRDPATGLQCFASEGDNANPSQTLRGAEAVWLGLDSAARAARRKAKIQSAGRDVALANARKWSDRKKELGEAIENSFFRGGCDCYTRDPDVGGTLLWPVGFVNYGSGRARGQARVNYAEVKGAFNGKVERGGLESKALLGNAYVWAGTRNLSKVKRGLKWVATVPTTDQTGILGEAWMVYPPDGGEVTTMVSQPHVWNQAIFYLAALKTYGSKRWSN